MDDAGTCAGIRPQLGVYLTGAIAPADRVIVVRHLSSCAGCRAELSGLAALPALLRRPPVRAAAQAPAAGDAGHADAGHADAGHADAGHADAGHADAGHADAGPAGSGGAGPGRLARRVARRRRRRRWLLAAAVFVLAVAAATGWALHLTGPPAPGPEAAATVLQTRTIGDVTVLTNAEGHTLYWFGSDSARKLACQAGCARTWPPVTGPASWGAGVTGTIGAIVRPDGTLQATYNGHPLYTATTDTGPGQAKGNGVWSDGGEWHEVTVPRRAG
jgi:predicted lipoprotein with Yx(FWY)xxD motif